MPGNVDLVNAYADRYTSALSPLAQEILEFTEAHHPKAHMMSGKLQGRFLTLLCRLMQPQHILEIGTFTGFSAMCMAEGMPATSQLHTIELREKDAQTAQGFFDRSAWAKQIHLHTGDALQVIPQLKQQWDFVFIDADKTGYINYYELTLPLLKTGGLIIADNVLFHGQVLAEKISGKNAIAMQAFNEHVAADERVEHLLLPLRDGLQLIRKK